MAIYEKSRFDGAFVHRDDSKEGNLYVDLLSDDKFSETTEEDYVIRFTEDMRLDLLSYEYYGDSDLDWVILQANPRFFTPLDIKAGDEIVIPHPERVNNNV